MLFHFSQSNLLQRKRKIPLFYDMKFELQVFVLSQATPPVPFPNSCCLRVDRKDRRTVSWYEIFLVTQTLSLPLCRASSPPENVSTTPPRVTEIGGWICGGGRVRKSAARELVNANRGWEISIYWLGCNQCSTQRFGWILTVVYVLWLLWIEWK